jgi:hypothetical protein
LLAFFDESGHPHPKDSSTRPVCVAVCIRQEQARFISGRLHFLKRNLIGKENLEFKANRLLNRPTFRRIPEKRELVEAFFDLLRNLPITIFAVIMERPQSTPLVETHYLANQFRYLLQRCDLLAQETKDMITILFDGDCQIYGGLSLKFNAFLYRSNEGQSMTTVTDAPFFVDSRVTSGIQIADMASGAIRLYQEHKLYQGVPAGDSFLSAIRRYYSILEEKTKDQETVEGYQRPGFYRMPEKDHYLAIASEGPQLAAEQAIQDIGTEKPENQP